MADEKPALRVSVFSDYICPFCYIGSRRLLRLRDDYDLRVNWCGLEIHPDTPAQGMPVDALGYPQDQWEQMQLSLARMAQGEGLRLTAHDFTTNSHQALLLAEAAKHQSREAFYLLHEALFEAFFSAGRNIGDEAVLRAIATQCALPDTLVDDAWHNPMYAERLRINLTHARELGIRGTPSYLFGKMHLSGAVPYASLREAAQVLLTSTTPDGSDTTAP